MVSIIIVNWNTRDLLLQCIQSIKDSTKDVPHEVVVVDNDSSDGSVEAVAERFPYVKLIASSENLGFAAGNNLGIAQATGACVLLLNPDTIVMPNSIREMLDFLETHPDAGAVGCKLLNADGTQQESAWTGFPGLGWLLARGLYLDKVLGRRAGSGITVSDKPCEVGHLLGACIMMPADLLREHGGFDESYFLYLEETDLCYRIRKAGRKVFYVPSASIVHIGQQSSMQAAEWTNVEFYANAYRFVRKYGRSGWLARLGFQSAIMMSGLIRLALWAFRLIGARSGREHARRMLSGYWRLCATVPRFELLYRKGLSAYRENGGNINDA